MKWNNTVFGMMSSMFIMIIVTGAIVYVVGDYCYKKNNPAEQFTLGNKKLTDYKLVVDTTYGSRSTHTERYSVFEFEDGTVYEIKKPCLHIDRIKIGSYYNLSYFKNADTIDEYKWGCRNAYVFEVLATNHQIDEGEVNE